MMKKILYILIAIVALFIAMSVYFGIRLNAGIGGDKDVMLVMPSAASVSLIVNVCNKEKLLTPGWLFKLYLKIYTELLDEKVYPGSYKFTPEHTQLDVVRAIFSGKQRYIIRITYPEGIRLEDFARLTAANLEIDSVEFIQLCHTKKFIESLGIKANSLEGYLMPDTYYFYLKTTADEVVRKLVSQQNQVWNELIKKVSGEKDINRHRILTLASIVEAETPVTDERPVVAGLYLNRLRIGKKLEADPTVSYALKGKKRLSYSDLDVDSPYNTYKFSGLPPGPINSPGRISIEAALKPDTNKYLYFVAKGDGSGSHYFSTNYNQHLKYSREYRKNRNNN